jgi:hypothetical protein
LAFVAGTFVSVLALPALGDINLDKKFECAGKVDNGLVTYREFPVFHFSVQRLKVTGSDIFSTYNFAVCGESGTVLSFATDQAGCHAGATVNNSLNSARGTLNNNTGQIEITGSQGLRGEYQCKEMIKK